MPPDSLLTVPHYLPLRWSCVTLALLVSSVKSLSVALWLAPLPTWPQRFCWTRATTAHWTCGLSESLCMSASVGRSHLMRMKISMTRSTTQPSCTLPTPGNRFPVMVNSFIVSKMQKLAGKDNWMKQDKSLQTQSYIYYNRFCNNGQTCNRPLSTETGLKVIYLHYDSHNKHGSCLLHYNW